MASDRDLYWRWVLRRDFNPHRVSVLSASTSFRSCPYCEGRLSIDAPEELATPADPRLGHDPDCRALSIGLTLDGGGTTTNPDPPIFGSSEPIFGSTDPVFGQA